MDRLHELADLARRHAALGVSPENCPGMLLITSSGVTPAVQVVYEPMLCVILEGAKQTTLGAESYVYHAGDYLVVTASAAARPLFVGALLPARIVRTTTVRLR